VRDLAKRRLVDIKDPSYGLEAVEQTTDQTILAKVAKNDRVLAVRVAAVKKLRSRSALEEIANTAITVKNTQNRNLNTTLPPQRLLGILPSFTITAALFSVRKRQGSRRR
jgi:hypothetical protein